MPARRTAALVLAMLAASVHAQPMPRAQGVLAHCAAHAPRVRGLRALRSACPGIGRALTQLGLTGRLPSGWRRSLTPTDLAGLARLTQRYAGPPPRWLLDEPLRAMARALKPPRPPPDAWSRFTAWVHRHTAPLMRRLRHWLRSLSNGAGYASLRHILSYALGALVLLVLLTLVLLEAHAAGKLRRGRTRIPPTTDTPSMPIADASGEAPDWARLASHPAGWLRALVGALTMSRRLDIERALTCRELTAHARFDSDAQRTDFQGIVALAEQELYGPSGPDPIPDDIRRRARALHAELSVPPSDPKVQRR